MPTVRQLAGLWQSDSNPQDSSTSAGPPLPWLDHPFYENQYLSINKATNLVLATAKDMPLIYLITACLFLT